MGLLQRGVIFAIGTVSNAIVFLFHSRVILEIITFAESFAPAGPGTDALNLLPAGMQLAMGVLQIGLIVYFLGGLGEEKATSKRPLP